jgi:transposase-like protein
MSKKFDFNEAVKALQSGQKLTGDDGVLTPLIKQLTEAALEGEIDSHLADEVLSNRRNGKSRKTVKSTSGSFELETPRDRAGNFEPQIVKKHQTTISDEIETKILSLYGLGMSYQDIAGHVKELYGIQVSTATISTITDKIIDAVKQWQQRPLDSHYPFIWLDAIHYKIRDNGRYLTKAIYTILALDIEGKKDVLGLYIAESQQPGRGGYSDRLGRWPGRIPRGHQHDFPANRGPALHCPPDPQFAPLCGLEKSEGLHGRPETGLPGRDAWRRRGRSG